MYLKSYVHHSDSVQVEVSIAGLLQGDFRALLDFIDSRNGPPTTAASSNTTVTVSSVVVMKPEQLQKTASNAQPAAPASKPPASAPPPSKPAQQAAPAKKPDEKPAAEGGDVDFFRMPTVKAIVTALLTSGVTSIEAVTKKCEELQGMGVPALDVVPVEDLPARVKAAFAQLGK